MTLLFDIDPDSALPPEVKDYEAYPDFGQPFVKEQPEEEMPENSQDFIEGGQNAQRAAADEEYRRKLEEAEKILEKAREDAKRLRGEAREAGYQEGYEEGKEKGYEEGFATGEQEAADKHREACQAELDNLQKQVMDAIVDMTHTKEKILEKYLDDLKNISLSVAEKIIQTSLKSSGDIVKRMIVASTEKLKKVAWAKIYVGRSEGGISIQGDSELIYELSRLSDNVKIVVMDEEPGTCIIELPNEIMDVSVGTQLENIRGILGNARV